MKREAHEIRVSVLQMRVAFEEQLQTYQTLLHSRVGELNGRLSLQQSKHVKTINAQKQFLAQKTKALRTAQATLKVFYVHGQGGVVVVR